MMDIKSINERIKQLCKQRNWSYYRLSKESGFQQSTLKTIRKETNMPSLYTIDKICNAFGITVADFFDNELFQDEANSKSIFISIWDELTVKDKEKVLIYMYGLTHKELKQDFDEIL